MDATNMPEATVMVERKDAAGVVTDGASKESTAPLLDESSSQIPSLDRRTRRRLKRKRFKERCRARKMEAVDSGQDPKSENLLPGKDGNDSRSADGDPGEMVRETVDTISSPPETKSTGQIRSYMRRAKKKLVDASKESSTSSNLVENKIEEPIDMNTGSLVAEEDSSLLKDGNDDPTKSIAGDAINSSADDKTSSKRDKKGRHKGIGSSNCSSDACTEKGGSPAQQVARNCAPAGNDSLSDTGKGDSDPTKTVCSSHNENGSSRETASDLVQVEHPGSVKTRKVTKETDIGKGDSDPTKTVRNSQNEHGSSHGTASNLIQVENPGSVKTRKVKKETDIGKGDGDPTKTVSNSQNECGISRGKASDLIQVEQSGSVKTRKVKKENDIGKGDGDSSKAVCNSHNENGSSQETGSDLIQVEHPGSVKTRKAKKETDIGIGDGDPTKTVCNSQNERGRSIGKASDLIQVEQPGSVKTRKVKKEKDIGKGDGDLSKAVCNSHNENSSSRETASDLIQVEHPGSVKTRKVKKETDKSSNCYICPSPIRGVVDDFASVDVLNKPNSCMDLSKEEDVSFSFQTTEQGFRNKLTGNHVEKACQSGSTIGTENISTVLTKNAFDSMSCSRSEMVDGQREKLRASSVGHIAVISSDVSKDEDQKTEVVPVLPEKTLVICTKKKLLVLDLNGLLADIAQDFRNIHKACKKVSGKAVYKRPFCDDFLKFCFERFDIGVWSSRKKYNVDGVVEYLMGNAMHKLLFCWDQSRCTFTGFQTIENKYKPLVLKELKKLWNKEEPDLPWEEGKYMPSNTLLVDDSPYKALCNPPYTAIFPQPYHANNENDNSLGPGGDLRVYLEGLVVANNVQDYVQEHPFGQPAITESDPSWKFYLKIRDKFSQKGTCSFSKIHKE